MSVIPPSPTDRVDAPALRRPRHYPQIWGWRDLEDVQAYCRQIASLLALDSLHDMDLLTGPDGVCLLEVNPRPSGSMVIRLRKLNTSRKAITANNE